MGNPIEDMVCAVWKHTEVYRKRVFRNIFNRLQAGSGKSHILNHLPLLMADDGKSNVIFYRRTNPQLEGGLWPNGRSIWNSIENNPDLPDSIKPRTIRDQKKEIILNNGMKIKYQQAENVQKSKDDAQGQEFTAVLVDLTFY
ncbi:terminase large subunit [Vibrio phage qdvp001]|uniref:terminase large subunit n=1 Tax=Vibrio phage qdvp001 TaxID=1003177 RepID=UPI000722F7C0|nr:terminase large subunit [Vibrio phage qdvp001]ALM62121.1 terminase large subunit [Vibrio phage qdvp001]